MAVARLGRRRAPVAWVLAGCLVGQVPTIPVAGSATASPASGVYTSASAQAAATGAPVEVTSQTTETSQVIANPDGTFTMTSSAVPVRVQRSGSWTPIDTTLHQSADGTWSPAAVSDDVRFSGGGSGPAVTIAYGSRSLSFGWPAALPAPVVSGNTATYSSVLPGVDLQLRARSNTYSEVLVVHSAAAAANPAIASLKLTASASGLNLATVPGGGMSATDAAGNEVFRGSAPVMWDSSVSSQVGPVPTASDSGSGKISLLGMSMPSANAATSPTSASTTLTLTAPAGALTGSNVVYPLYLDPSVTPQITPFRSHFSVVFSNGWHYYDDTSNDLKVGYCGFSDCNGIGTGRTYLSFDTKALTGQATTAHIYDAAVSVYEIHSASACTATPLQLWSAGVISPSTVWDGPNISQLQQIDTNRSDDCSSAQPAYVSFSNASVVTRFQSAATNDNESLTFGLIAENESSSSDWKRFASDGTTSSAAKITVHYSFPPSQPTGLSVAGEISCASIPYVATQTPTLSATAHDNNPSSVPVGFSFSVWDRTGSTNIVSNPTRVDANPDSSGNAHGSWTSTATLSDDTVYSFHVFATAETTLTPLQQSSTSSWHPFHVKVSKPAAPTISSFDYPAGIWGAPAAAPGAFNLAGSSDTIGFAYSFDSSTLPSPKPTDCASSNTGTSGFAIGNSNVATLQPPAGLATGYHTLYVEAFDGAHNVSLTAAQYVFYVSPNVAGEGSVKVEAESAGLSQRPGQGNGTDSCFSSAVNGLPSYVDTAAQWSGGRAERLVASGPASFTFQITPSSGAPVTADYALGVQVNTDNHYGQLAFDLNGVRLPETVDSFAAIAGTTFKSLGAAHLVQGTVYILTVDITGTSGISAPYSGTYGGISINCADRGYSANIDDFTLIPINNVTAASFDAARNNHGIAVDGSSAANFGPSTDRFGLSQQALIAAGFTSGPNGLSKTVDGVPFTIDPAAADGSDNVIAGGQTIPLNQPTPASYVDLLVASTCGATTSDTTVRLHVVFDNESSPGAGDETVTDYQLPSVPDWVTGATGTTPAVTLDHRDLGAAPESAAKPVYIYHLHIPTQWTFPGVPRPNVRAIQLPYMGSNMFADSACSVPTLHVLALSASN